MAGMWLDEVTTYGWHNMMARWVCPPTTAVTVVVPVTVAPVTLAAADASRKQLYIWNDSGAIIYVKLGAGATPTLFTKRLANNEGWELPLNGYNGLVTACRASGTGPVLVTIVTP